MLGYFLNFFVMRRLPYTMSSHPIYKILSIYNNILIIESNPKEEDDNIQGKTKGYNISSKSYSMNDKVEIVILPCGIANDMYI